MRYNIFQVGRWLRWYYYYGVVHLFSHLFAHVFTPLHSHRSRQYGFGISSYIFMAISYIRKIFYVNLYPGESTDYFALFFLILILFFVSVFDIISNRYFAFNTVSFLHASDLKRDSWPCDRPQKCVRSFFTTIYIILKSRVPSPPLPFVLGRLSIIIYFV